MQNKILVIALPTEDETGSTGEKNSCSTAQMRQQGRIQMIIKNEIPILEYDDSSIEVIAPNHDMEDLKLPEKCLFAFLGDVIHE